MKKQILELIKKQIEVNQVNLKYWIEIQNTKRITECNSILSYLENYLIVEIEKIPNDQELSVDYELNKKLNGELKKEIKTMIQRTRILKSLI